MEIAKQNSEKKLEELSAAKTPRISSNLTKKKTPVFSSFRGGGGQIKFLRIKYDQTRCPSSNDQTEWSWAKMGL